MFVFFFRSRIGTLRLSESEPQSSSTSESPYVTHCANTTKSTTPLDVLSNDYADMTLGNSKCSMRNTGPTLSPKENIKKLKSSFFGCNKIDENKMDCSSKQLTNPSTTVTTNSKNSTCDEGDYTLMNPVLGKHNAPQPVQMQPTQVPIALKKTALVTTNNDPDNLLANTQVKTSIDGFKPITSRADKVFHQNKSIPSANSSFSRQHSAPVEKPRKPSADNSGYEMLELRASSSAHAMGGRIARPNSVNSEKTAFTPLMRPNSANSERQSTSTFSLTSTPLNEMGTQSVRIRALDFDLYGIVQ